MKKKTILLGTMVCSISLILASCTVKKASGASNTSSASTTSKTDVPTTSKDISSVNSESSTIPPSPPQTSTIIPTSSSSIKTETSTSTTLTSNKTEGDVTIEGTVKIKEVVGGLESAYVLFNKVNNATSYNFYINGENYNTHTLLDEKVVYTREINGEIRADLIGLKSGNYTLEIRPIINNILDSNNGTHVTFSVSSYDRSGYAHFKNTEGVGAYNDDGTLKDNAIVIYVTDVNKDNIMTNITTSISDINMFNIPGSDWNSKEASGIGWWLNNAQYTKKDKSGNPGNTYSSSGTNLGFYSVCENHSIVIRFIGTVLTPEGLTAYDSLNEGGSVGDNGHMARMKDLANVTIEGVGDDAIIDGWGFHFMSSSTNSNRGKNFEVRNLTFVNYPEDAIGMEGTQSSDSTSATISSTVCRCWVHHNTFFPGYCQNPAESDKAEGDGSCDFKRGRYYTLSYNYFEYCHKTNLIGSSDTSLQYDMSIHHNIWYNCGSRIPLLRNGNVHFYNNYILGNDKVSTASPTSTIHSHVGMKASLSYITSLRANSYMYSEYNYYEGAKQVFTNASGGVSKSFNNTYLQCYNDPSGNTDVNSREEVVENNCKYQALNIDYSTFDTNSSLFYYDSVNKKSDCYLTDSSSARVDCILKSGSNYRTVLNKVSLKLTTKLNEFDVTNKIELKNNETLNATLPSSKASIVIDNIAYNNITGVTSGSIKFKGQGITFNLTTSATITISISSSNSNSYGSGYLVGSNGIVYLTNSGSVDLNPGTYFIASVQKDKETTLSSLTLVGFESSELNQKRIEEYNSALSKIGEVSYTNECYSLISDAMNKYNSLSDDLQKNVNYKTLEEKYNTYLTLGKSYVESLINDIGEVTKDSENKIVTARNAYNELLEINEHVVISNYNVLVLAENSYKTFAVDNVISLIDGIGDVTLESESLIIKAENSYNALSTDDKNKVTNYNKLQSARNIYNNLVLVNEVDKLILANPSTLVDLNNLYLKYNSLTAELKSQLKDKNTYDVLMVKYVNLLIDSLPNSSSITLEYSSTITLAKEVYDKLIDKSGILNYTKLEECISKIEELKNQRQVLTFNTGASGDNSFFTVSGNLKANIASKAYDNVIYTSALKMESATSIKFTLTKKCKVTIITDSANAKIKINGKSYTTDSNGVLVIELEAGEYTITKGASLNLYAIIVE